MAATRPPCIRNWRDLEAAEESRHPATGEARGFASDFGGATGLARLGVRHHRLPPGRRSSPPHAERDEEELIIVLEGTPDLWQDGFLHRLKPGFVAFWPDRTGISHSLINNTDEGVRFLAIGEASRYGSRVAFPCDPAVADWFGGHGKLWSDPPSRRLGPHDGHPGEGVRGSRKRNLPDNVIDTVGAKVKRGTGYPGDTEKMADFINLNLVSGLGRVGGGIDLLAPGRRTSWPHAERDEEEFTFVVSGAPEVWLDGEVYPLGPGDFVGWPSGTGQAHVVLNNAPEIAVLATFGEASRQRSGIWYPFHARHMKTLGARAWIPSPKPRFGSHDGLTDKLRTAKLRSKSSRP
jgi:uncharacterized cupin superfamily protein